MLAQIPGFFGGLDRGLRSIGNEIKYVANTIGTDKIPYNLSENNEFLRKPDNVGQAAKDELPALTPAEERAYQLEASRLAQQAATDPYFKMNELYRSAQQNLNLDGEPGADNRMAVEKLGLAIHAAKYGDPNPRGLSARTGQDTDGAVISRDQATREQAMNLAADTVNQLLNPQQNKAVNAQMFTPAQGQGARGQAGFNTSATFDLGAIRPAITDMQVNLNPMVANRSGEEGFMFDKNILDEKKLAAFQLQNPRRFV